MESLDGDEVRRHLSKGLGFSKEDRDENIRPIGFAAELLTRNGVVVYKKARSGELRAFTGVSDPYEPPLAPEVECNTHREMVAESVEKVMRAWPPGASLLREQEDLA